MSTLRLPHCKQTRRRRHSGTGVPGPHQRACSPGSSSTLCLDALHQTIRRGGVAKVIGAGGSPQFSTPLPVPLIKRVTERSRRQNASKCHQQGNDKRCSQDHRVYMMVFFFCTCCRRGACPPPAPSSRDHTSAPARPGQVRSLAHGGRLVRPVKVSGFIGVRNRWTHPGTVQLMYSFGRP